MKTINKISDGINKAVELVTVILFVILIVACVFLIQRDSQQHPAEEATHG